MPEKKVHKLKYNQELDFNLFGITSDEKDYKLIWDINNVTGWNLERQDDYTCFNRKTGEEMQFPLFIYHDENNYISYKLIANQHNNSSLLEELKNLDYLFIITDESDNPDIPSLTKKLRKVQSIRAIFSIDPSKLRDRERLVF